MGYIKVNGFGLDASLDWYKAMLEDEPALLVADRPMLAGLKKSLAKIESKRQKAEEKTEELKK